MKLFIHLGGLVLCLLLVGCGAAAKRTGYLSTYDQLDRTADGQLHAGKPADIASIQRVYVEPVEMRLDSRSNVTDEQARQITAELHQMLSDAIARHRTLAANPAPDAARLHVALTRIRKGVWLLNLHPGAKLMGSGLGGAAIEAELLDPKGRQLWALVEMRKGDQMELDTFDELDDPRDAIEHWRKVIDALFTPATADGAN